VAGCCERSTERPGFIKGGELFDQLSVLAASQDGLCSMELVIKRTETLSWNIDIKFENSSVVFVF
jgi:hypothetical protein